ALALAARLHAIRNSVICRGLPARRLSRLPSLQRRLPMSMLRVLLIVLLVSLLSGCGYNAIQQKDEAVKAAWSEVINQYQRRADLVPNLVNTVKGYAAHEERVLTEVTEA